MKRARIMEQMVRSSLSRVQQVPSARVQISALHRTSRVTMGQGFTAASAKRLMFAAESCMEELQKPHWVAVRFTLI